MSEPQLSVQQIVPIFCAKCQKNTPHSLSKDGNGEFLFECLSCDRFIKLAANSTLTDIEDYIQRHEQSNQGQIDTSKTDAVIAEFLAKHGQEITSPIENTETVQPENEQVTPTPEGITA